MQLCLIDKPIKIDLNEYHSLLKEIIEIVKRDKRIVSVYQIGSISNPGISDLDIVFIFKDNSFCFDDYRMFLNSHTENIVTHEFFGCCESQFKISQNLSFYHNYKLLYGIDLYTSYQAIDHSHDITGLKRQIALEYLIKFYISLTIQITYKVLKVRSFLLEAKALKFDLQFLNSDGNDFAKIVDEIIFLRNNYFNKEITNSEIEFLSITLLRELHTYINIVFKSSTLYLPISSGTNYRPNIKLHIGEELSVQHFGFSLYKLLHPKSKAFFNIHKYLNHFDFFFPWVTNTEDQVIINRFYHSNILKFYNKSHLPHFSPLLIPLLGS